MTFLAVAVSAANTNAARVALRQTAGRADLAELRLDLMAEFNLPALLADRLLPLIVTCRPQREGGGWAGDETQRLAVLRQAAALGADYVDLEWDAAHALASLDRSHTRVILSRHDFSGMPDDLEKLAGELWQAGPDAIKVVGMAQRLADSAAVLRLLAQAQRPTIAIAMGPSGLVSRLLAFRYPQALLSFAAPDPAAEAAATGTAPGQITLSAMRDLYRVQTISQHTALVGLAAPDANCSPLLIEGNRWLQRQGIDAVLLPLQHAADENPATAIAALRAVAPWAGVIAPGGGLDALRRLRA